MLDNVGAVADIKYVEENDDASIVTVRETLVTTNVTSTKLVEYVLVAAAVARTTQLPAPVNVKTAVDEFTVQPVEPALVTEYVITPLPEVEAKIEGVFGESAVDNAVVGDHETTCADTVEVVVVLVAAVVGTVGTGEGEIVTTRGTVVATPLPVVGGIVTRAVVGGIVARTDVGGAGGDT